ncbi:hypothetical protein SKAU_G00184780 [Synaphobranchus kaupii]|uniref:Uncharacterized protein n=1 Tax=Synaphobranchus kaupii TaxID=118154 RepID=A0A9Q1FCI3_SYNKA|nr:hypothetical protein SKAU_G00184780 [Synaphobranchus kaupii]
MADKRRTSKNPVILRLLRRHWGEGADHARVRQLAPVRQSKVLLTDPLSPPRERSSSASSPISALGYAPLKCDQMVLREMSSQAPTIVSNRAAAF